MKDIPSRENNLSRNGIHKRNYYKKRKDFQKNMIMNRAMSRNEPTARDVFQIDRDSFFQFICNFLKDMLTENKRLKNDGQGLA